MRVIVLPLFIRKFEMKSKEEFRHGLTHFTMFAKWCFCAVIIGAFVGCVGTLFHYLIQYSAQTFAVSNQRMVWLLPIVGLVIVASYKLCGMDNDKGTNMILVSVRSEEKPPIFTAPLIFFSTVLTHLAGGSAGREGAAIQMGGGIGKYGSDKEISGAVEIMNNCLKEDPDQSRQSVYEEVITALKSPEFLSDSFKNILKKAIELDGTDRDTESPEKEKDITPEQHKEKTPRDILNEITAGTITAKEVADLEGKYSYPVYAILVAAMLKRRGDEEKIQEISKIFEKGIEEDQDPERVIIYKRVCGALRTEEYPSNAFSSILEDTIKLEEEHPEHQGEEEIK